VAGDEISVEMRLNDMPDREISFAGCREIKIHIALRIDHYRDTLRTK